MCFELKVVLLSGAGSFLSLLSILILYKIYMHHKNKVISDANVQERLRVMETEIGDLNAVKERSRQTGSTTAGIEDALSMLISMQYNREIEKERLDATMRMLQQMRKGPYQYESKPTGKRKDFK